MFFLVLKITYMDKGHPHEIWLWIFFIPLCQKSLLLKLLQIEAKFSYILLYDFGVDGISVELIVND